MKITDLTEADAKFAKNAKNAMPKSFSIPNIDQYYEYYRFLVSIAGFPDDVPISGPISDGAYISPYSQVEHDQSVALLTKMGKTIKHISTSASNELSSTNTVSPVRKFVDLDGLK